MRNILTTILNQLVDIERQRERLDSLEDEAVGNLIGMEVKYRDYYAIIEYISVQSNELGLYLEKPSGEQRSIILPITEFIS